MRAWLFFLISSSPSLPTSVVLRFSRISLTFIKPPYPTGVSTEGCGNLIFVPALIELSNFIAVGQFPLSRATIKLSLVLSVGRSRMGRCLK